MTPQSTPQSASHTGSTQDRPAGARAGLPGEGATGSGAASAGAADAAPRGPLQTARGVTTLDDAVVAKIAGMAARSVPGVHDMGNAARRMFSAVTDRIPNAQTNVAGGISVEKGDTQAAIDVTVVVEYGASIVEVGDAIRRSVIDQVETTTGLEVIEVNVNVVDVHLPEDDEAPAARETELR